METLIRKFNEGDLEACISIISQTLGKRDAKSARHDFIEGMRPKTHEYSYLKRIVACNTSLVVGVGGVYRLISHPEDYAGICWYAVSPEYQKKGVGTSLLVEMENQVRKDEYGHFFVWATKEAVEFYRRFGFRQETRKIKPRESSIFLLKDL